MWIRVPAAGRGAVPRRSPGAHRTAPQHNCPTAAAQHGTAGTRLQSTRSRWELVLLPHRGNVTFRTLLHASRQHLLCLGSWQQQDLLPCCSHAATWQLWHLESCICFFIYPFSTAEGFLKERSIFTKYITGKHILLPHYRAMIIKTGLHFISSPMLKSTWSHIQ